MQIHEVCSAVPQISRNWICGRSSFKQHFHASMMIKRSRWPRISILKAVQLLCWIIYGAIYSVENGVIWSLFMVVKTPIV